jgi:N-acetyltransferase
MYGRLDNMADRVVLQGRVALLEPLALANVDGLFAAASEDRSSYRYTRVPDNAEDMRSFVAKALEEEAAGVALPFAVRRADSGQTVGTSRFLELEYWSSPTVEGSDCVPNVAEIGSTWLAASAQRTSVNTEVKLLMLTHAFETWRVARVSFQTDARNQRSRTAIESIGAKYEGVRRAHKFAADGSIRNTAFFSIVRDEWPHVRLALVQRLGNG